MPFTSAPELDQDVIALVERLSAVPAGQTITFAELDKAIGRPVRSVSYLLQKAFRKINASSGAVFASVHRVGYKRLETAQISSVGVRARGQIRRKVRTAQLRIANAVSKVNDLAPEVKRAINIELSALGLIEHVAADKFARDLDTPERTAPAPTAVAAREFMKHIGVVTEAAE